MIKIATFNVNSINARLPKLLDWLKNSKPDIVCLQELKCEEKNFPFEALSDAGFNIAVNCQKSYNGVAILSKYKIDDVIKNLPMLDNSNETDPQARYIECVISVNNQAIRVASIYVPNGGSELMADQKIEQSEKFIYKLNFYDRLQSHISSLASYDEIQIFAGDYNVACQEIDIYDPKGFEGQILFHLQERIKFRNLLNIGLIDSYRVANQESQAFTWWDYRGNSYAHNKGARIDYLLVSPKCADLIAESDIENEGVRDQEKASDHCPTFIKIDLC